VRLFPEKQAHLFEIVSKDVLFSGGTCLMGQSVSSSGQERKCDMLITTAHLFALQELAAGEAAGSAAHMLTEDEEQEFVYHGLDMSRRGKYA
jgi:hypothetical protein